MKVLFIHQNFPGQFKHLAPALATAGHDVHALRHTGKLNSNDHANDRVISAGDEVITFVSRNLEPYRGYHIFMRALPDILRRLPGYRQRHSAGAGSVRRQYAEKSCILHEQGILFPEPVEGRDLHGKFANKRYG